jgi:hypothetical protein
MDIGPVEILSSDDDVLLTPVHRRRRSIDDDDDDVVSSSVKKKKIEISEDEDEGENRRKMYSLRKRETKLPRLNIRAQVKSNRAKTLAGTSDEDEEEEISEVSSDEIEIKRETKRTRGKNVKQSIKKSSFIEKDFRAQRSNSSGYDAEDLREFIAHDDEEEEIVRQSDDEDFINEVGSVVDDLGKADEFSSSQAFYSAVNQGLEEEANVLEENRFADDWRNILMNELSDDEIEVQEINGANNQDLTAVSCVKFYLQYIANCLLSRKLPNPSTSPEIRVFENLSTSSLSVLESAQWTEEFRVRFVKS